MKLTTVILLVKKLLTCMAIVISIEPIQNNHRFYCYHQKLALWANIMSGLAAIVMKIKITTAIVVIVITIY